MFSIFRCEDRVMQGPQKRSASILTSLISAPFRRSADFRDARAANFEQIHIPLYFKLTLLKNIA